MKPGGGNKKGATFEQECVRLAKAYGYAAADRTGYKQRSGKNGVKKADPDIVNVGPLWLEGKRLARCPGVAEYREALDKERPGYVNALVWRANRDPAPRVTLLFEDLLKIMSAAHTGLTEDGLRDWLNGKMVVLPGPPVGWDLESKPVTVEDALTTMALGPKKGDA